MIRRTSLILLLIVSSSCNKVDFSAAETIAFGHAGEGIRNGRNKFPPNTLESINYIFENTTIDGAEIDVQMTKDSQLVVYHDFELSENSDATGCIPNMNWSELQNVKVYKTDLKISKLSDVLSIALAQDKMLYLDVKYLNDCSGEFVNFQTFNNSLNQVLDPYSNQQKENIIINATSLSLIQSITDTSLIKSLETDNFVNILSVLVNNDIQVLTTKLKSINDQQIQSIQEVNKKVCLYQLYTSAENKEAIRNKADYIITDKVGCAAQLLNGK